MRHEKDCRRLFVLVTKQCGHWGLHGTIYVSRSKRRVAAMAEKLAGGQWGSWRVPLSDGTPLTRDLIGIAEIDLAGLLCEESIDTLGKAKGGAQ